MIRKKDISKLAKADLLKQIGKMQPRKSFISRFGWPLAATVLITGAVASVALVFWKKKGKAQLDEEGFSSETADEGAWKKMVMGIRARLNGKNSAFKQQPTEAVSEANSTLPDDH